MAEILVDGDVSHRRWIEIALGYMPPDVLQRIDGNLAVVGLGSIGACRLPDQYRQRELVVVADWIFPPAGHSEGEDTGRFFIIALLHEVAHALCRHKSPLLDGLSPEDSSAQEEEADEMAVEWFNQYVGDQRNPNFRPVERAEFRRIVDRFAALADHLEREKVRWHRENGA